MVEFNGIGLLNISEEALWAMTYRAFTFKLAAYLTKQEHSWQHTRYLASVLINCNRNWKRPLVQPDDLKGKKHDQDYAEWVASEMIREEEEEKKKQDASTRTH